MKIEIENVGVMYPNEQQADNRNLRFNLDGDLIHLNIIDAVSLGSITFDKKQLTLLRDSINIYLKNNLIEEFD